MADATRLSVMSKQIEDNKQATDDLKAQMADLMKHQADLCKSQSHMEAMLSMLVSQSRGQTSHAPVLNSPPSGCLTASTTPPQPPDPPDFNQFGQRLSKLEFPVFDGTLLDCWIAKVENFFELEQYGNEEKLDFISLSVEGAALKWFRRHRREFTDWTDIKRKLMARFGSEKESTDSVEITSIKGHEVQGTTVSHLATSCVDNSVVENQKKLAWKDETPVFEHLHEPSRLFDDQSQAKLIQSQAKLIQSLENLETMMPRFFSQTSIPPRPPSQPPDPPDVFLPLLSELMSLKQHDDSVEMYLVKFERALSRLSLPVAHVLNIFLTNMSSHLASHVRQFDVTIVSDAAWIAKRFESSLINTPAIQPRAPFNPYQTQNNQSQDNNMTQQEELIQDIETIREIGLIQEHESPKLTDAIMEVDCVHSQEFSSQFQVPIPSLEPSRRYHKESLNVVKDLSYDHGCVTGLNLGKLLKNERLFSIICLLGLNDMSCWTQLLRQQIFPKSWRFKFKTASRESKLLDNNFSGNIKLIKQSLSGDNELIWTQFSSLVKASEMSVLGRDKWKWSEKHRMYNKAWKFKYIQRLMLSVLLQMEQYKLLQGRTIKCKMRKKEVLRRIKQSIFIEMQFHMKNNSEFSFQANTRVLELIKDKASRKRKLCKNWWFKYKLSTWFSEALHFWRKRKYEKLQRASEHMMCELIHKIRKACQCVVHETNETASHVWYWWKTKAEIVQIVLKPIMHLKGKEETYSFKDAATNCSSKTKISGHVLKQVFGRATHGLFLKQSLSQFLLHIQNRDCSFFGYTLMATSDCFGTLLEIPDKEIAKPHNIYVLKALILWKWYPPEQATWIFSELIQNSLDMSIFGKSRTWLLCKVRIVHDLKDLRQFTRAGIKFHLKHKWRSKFGSSKLTRTWTRQKAWPRVPPRLHVRAFNLSFLRTRMFSKGEYCDRFT